MTSADRNEHIDQNPLPVVKILFGAFAITWINRQNLLRGLGPTALTIIIINLVWQNMHTKLPDSAGIIFWLISMVLYAKFAVICHRLVLLDFGVNGNTQWPVSWTDRESRFFGRMMVVYFLVSIGSILIVMFPFMLFAQYIPESARKNPAELLPYVALFVGLPATYLLGRLSLIFPATALDNQQRLAWAWSISKSNGLRLAVIVGLLPWISGLLNYLLHQQNPSLAALLAGNIVNYIFLTIEITALSLAYREITRQAASPATSPATS